MIFHQTKLIVAQIAIEIFSIESSDSTFFGTANAFAFSRIAVTSTIHLKTHMFRYVTHVLLLHMCFPEILFIKYIKCISIFYFVIIE